MVRKLHIGYTTNTSIIGMHLIKVRKVYFGFINIIKFKVYNLSWLESKILVIQLILKLNFKK